MPQHLVKINLDLICPAMVTPLLEVLAECERRGKSYVAYSGRRTFHEQNVLWTHGRTKLYDPKGNKLGIVTNSQGGFSLHNYGLGVDCYVDSAIKPGLQPDWSAGEDAYELLREVGEKWGFQVGLINNKGKRWDFGHMQIPIKRLYDTYEAKVLGHWKMRVRDEGEDKAIKQIWREVSQLWPLDSRK